MVTAMTRSLISVLLLFSLRAEVYDLGALRWRNIGPNRGVRSLAAAGSAARPLEYYFGATGGGLWKTTDSGTFWQPVTDGQIRSSSVGAVAVSESHPNVVYIGTGESELRHEMCEAYTIEYWLSWNPLTGCSQPSTRLGTAVSSS